MDNIFFSGFCRVFNTDPVDVFVGQDNLELLAESAQNEFAEDACDLADLPACPVDNVQDGVDIIFRLVDGIFSLVERDLYSTRPDA